MIVKGKIYPHKYEPLISQDMFLRAHMVAKNWNKKPFKYAALPYIFRGMIKCDICGCTVTPEKAKKKYVYYSCTNYYRKHKREWVPESKLLKPVLEALTSIKVPEDKIAGLTEKLREIHQTESVYHQQTMDSLKREYDKMDQRVNKLLDTMLDGDISKDVYDTKLRELKEKQQDILMQMQDHKPGR